MNEYKMNYEDEMTYYLQLTKKLRKLYVRNEIIEILKEEIKTRSRFLYHREMKNNAYLGRNLIFDIVSEKVSREVKTLQERKPDDYNRVCELYGLSRIKKRDSDYIRMIKHENQFVNEYIHPRLTPTEDEIKTITDSVVER
ncbi:hypothetical protein [Vibrio parahaemolyticus]|uniref:hypothetical protein n=1 Tax=Vibrio parahaemolyticus TaxID=670 RepID=UPI000C86DE47|nr:hypothetical protein [Vibrio parahaemolyticus]EIA1494021.1 hypothetical protein [Vibrio parahaemolyticus]ELA7319234.1 hypothetical protein [Vibrio parahaemolyticus]PMT62628.1 hypothetical protein C1S87_03630 [Vibrio parahaemolyticus]PMT89412.1 hypothetical protein C1S83_03630 [Vibrio parahaemolyticus]PMT92672.1 hypothetical protein C1T03_03630 [Vibrio parahaemolyticus]